ncbi:hypothetical protein [Mesorhizobium sp. WSM3860]|uniref:hypothetical protein n=1 Tax=Mesorhizobium sp. WSM3860 TaxID=2029403 RepID=UPI001140EA43|nr:hypothetical protein [Mesorhizobium sp. WSM3860]
MLSLDLIADLVTIAGLPAATAGLGLAFWEARANRRANSAALYNSIAQSIREEMKGFEAAKTQDEQEDHLSEVLNWVEVGCALHHDGLLAGRTGQILRHTIDEIQDKIALKPNLKALASKLTTHPHTFSNSEAYRADSERKRAREQAITDRKSGGALPSPFSEDRSLSGPHHK